MPPTSDIENLIPSCDLLAVALSERLRRVLLLVSDQLNHSRIRGLAGSPRLLESCLRRRSQLGRYDQQFFEVPGRLLGR